MNRKTLKYLVIGLLAALAVLAVARIVMKVMQGGRQAEKLVYSVGPMVLKKKPVDVQVSFEGIIQGDPQVKVYPQVSGKFQGNAVQEGTTVRPGTTIAFINRDIVGADYLYSPVRSPIAGMVTKLYFIDKGAAITPSSAVAEVANIENVKLVINVGQDDLMKIRKDQKAVLYPKNGESNFLVGTVYSVAPFVDSDTLSGGIVIKAPNKNNLMRVGMSVTVDISVGKRDMILVPESAIIMGLDRVYVYVNSNGRAKQVDVVRGYVKDEMVEITGNFRDGDLLITDGNYRLNDGVPLRILSTNGFVPAPIETVSNRAVTNHGATNVTQNKAPVKKN